MKRHKIKIDPKAIADIQEIVEWYESVRPGLGKRFLSTSIRQINSLKMYPQMYSVRYKEIRCMLVRKFPCMVHFYVNNENNTVEILAVINTNRNPEVWRYKTDR